MPLMLVGHSLQAWRAAYCQAQGIRARYGPFLRDQRLERVYCVVLAAGLLSVQPTRVGVAIWLRRKLDRCEHKPYGSVYSNGGEGAWRRSPSLRKHREWRLAHPELDAASNAR